MSPFCHSTKLFHGPVIFDSVLGKLHTELHIEYSSKSWVNTQVQLNCLKVLFLQGCDNMLAAYFMSNCAEGSACNEQCLWSVFAMCAAW